MSYVDKHLLRDEMVLYRTQLHWKVYAIPVICAAITLGILVIVINKAGYSYFEVFFLIPATVLFISAYLTRSSSEFAVTNRRVMMKTGVIRTASLEILLNKVEAISVNQNLLGKILNYGDIVITGSGGTKELYRGIEGPLGLRNAVQEATPA
ncbi:MAG TPA: PH domain-containing protein [Dissulfurispiraceae bacterium]|nr:PH domain-containing protein [Dissulfurispiraceae bacterium]